MSDHIIDVNTMFGFWPWRRVDMRLETLLSIAAAHGVTRVCAACTRSFFIDHHVGNDEVLSAAAEHEMVFPVGGIDMRAGPVPKQISRWCEAGLRWFRFFTAQAWTLDNLVFQDLLGPLGEHGCVLMIPARMELSAIASVADRYDHPIIVLEPSFGTLAELHCLLQRPHVYADVCLMNAVDGLSWLAEQGHGDQLLFGSRAPLCYMASALGLVNDPIIDDELRGNILAGNAARLMQQSA